MIARATRALIVMVCFSSGLMVPSPMLHAAEEPTTYPIDRREGQPLVRRVRASVLGTPASSRPGGYGWVRVELVNPTDKPTAIAMTLTPTHGSAERCRFQRTVRLDAEQSVTLDMPLPVTRYGNHLEFRVDGRTARAVVNLSGDPRGPSNSLVALAIVPGGASLTGGSSSPDSEPWSLLNRHLRWVLRVPSQLPSRWPLLSGFDLVVVAAGQKLDEAQQALLLDYVASGGNLLFEARPHALLSAVIRDGEAFNGVEHHRAGRHGLGYLLQMPQGTDFVASEPAYAWFLHVGPFGSGPLTNRQGDHAGGVPEKLWLPLRVPGLGEVPTGLFFFLILAFALLVGPLSYLYFRRRRRLLMLLVTIPVLGFCCTLLILGYGYFSEGLGIVGSARSFTVLDQASQRAMSVRGSTLYAGLQPSSLEARLDSHAESGSFYSEDDTRGAQARLQVDLDQGFRISGSLLPPRTPTPFISSTVATARDRLRFRLHSDDDGEWLSVPGFEPLAGQGQLVLRTFDGAYWIAAGEGRLEPMEAADLSDALQALLAPVEAMPLGSGAVITSDHWSVSSVFVTASDMERRAAREAPIDAWIRDRVGELRPGSYLARMARSPLMEDLGLDVEYRAEEHVVYGLLAEKDILRD